MNQSKFLFAEQFGILLEKMAANFTQIGKGIIFLTGQKTTRMFTGKIETFRVFICILTVCRKQMQLMEQLPLQLQISRE